jgi:hypothetical protein
VRPPLLAACCSFLLADVAVASEHTPTSSAAAIVQQDLITPMTANAEATSGFSRGPPAHTVYRVVLPPDAPTLTDVNGHRFVAFTVDSKTTYGGGDGDWRVGILSGCVTLDDEVVYVTLGASHRTAGVFVGAQPGGDVAEPVCVAARTEG